jgi:hypothetical protein
MHIFRLFSFGQYFANGYFAESSVCVCVCVCVCERERESLASNLTKST